jgi:hypothetical protein
VLAALEEIRIHTGTQFSRSVVDALEELAREEPGLLIPRQPKPRMRVA